MKEQIGLTDVKYLWLSLSTSWALVFSIDTHVYTISKDIGINKEKEIYLLNRESIKSGHRLERTNMVSKCIVHMCISAELKAYMVTLSSG